jgi:prevent-host-death family protein
MKHPAAAMTLTDARTNLLDVATSFEKPSARPVQVTKRGKHVMTLVPAEKYEAMEEKYEAMEETLAILVDDKAMAGIRRGLADLKAGRTIPWETARRKLGV